MLFMKIRLWLIHKLGAVEKERYDLLDDKATCMANEINQYIEENKKLSKDNRKLFNEILEYKANNTTFAERVTLPVCYLQKSYSLSDCYRNASPEELWGIVYRLFVADLVNSEDLKNTVLIQERFNSDPFIIEPVYKATVGLVRPRQ